MGITGIMGVTGVDKSYVMVRNHMPKEEQIYNVAQEIVSSGNIKRAEWFQRWVKQNEINGFQTSERIQNLKMVIERIVNDYKLRISE